MSAQPMMEHASPEEHGDSVSDGDASGDEEVELKQDPDAVPSGPSSISDIAANGASAVKAPSHLQKRRRVTRACDECRRKKIKCDGKQPCTHCTVYSYECTYDQPSNRRRNPAPQYVENLEHRVHRAETLLHILIPNLDLNDPGIDAAVAQGWIPGAPGRGNPASVRSRQKPVPQTNGEDTTADQQNKSDTNLESMIRAVAQMDIDEEGFWDYRGHSSGLSFVRRMREQLGELMGPETHATPFVKSRPISQVLDSPKSMSDSPAGDASSTSGMDLPQKEYARRMCRAAVDDAAALMRFLHKPSFWHSFERLYSTPQDHYTNEDNKFLPLFHTAMALGHLFQKEGAASMTHQGYEDAIQQGFIHFKTARQMMDIADCRDLTSVQAVIFMILFLQSSAKMSQCYGYIGVALRSALRMGLHRSCVGMFSPLETEVRKRVFWTVRAMDIYVGAMLGLPQTLSEDDIDQEYPVEVDDEYITEDGISSMPEGVVSLMTAFNAHIRLVNILRKIVLKVYPTKIAQGSADRTYSVPFSVVREIEGDLEEWKSSLPPILHPCQAPERYIRIQQLLRASYAHAQVMLYRPFLHFVAMEKRAKPIDQRAYACAASFVNVSRNIIHIASQMKQQGLLDGAYWFVMYTTFFAIISLVYFAAENPDNATTQAVMKDAITGRQILASLSRRSMAADRCTATLNGMFSKLPAWMREGQQNPVMPRKRPFEANGHAISQQVQHPTQGQASRGHPDVPAVSHDMPKRASTFPRHGSSVPINITPGPLDVSWPQSAASPFAPQTPNSIGFEQNVLNGWSTQNVPNSIPNGPSQFPASQSYPNRAIPELSAMMFPTADEPFVYPNQPLTTFENNQQSTDTNNFVGTSTNFAGLDPSGPIVSSPTRNSGRDDNIEAQLFALPPYMEQRQPQPPTQPQHAMTYPGAADGIPFAGTSAMSAQAPLQMANEGGWLAQQNHINIQDLFGGAEWNSPFTNPGFQSQ